MSELNPYEAPQQSGTTSDAAEQKLGSSGGVNQLALGGAFISQLALMAWLFWQNSHGGMEGLWLFMAIGVCIIGCFLGLLITAIVLRSWNLVIVQVLVFVIDLFIFMTLM